MNAFLSSRIFFFYHRSREKVNVVGTHRQSFGISRAGMKLGQCFGLSFALLQHKVSKGDAVSKRRLAF